MGFQGSLLKYTFFGWDVAHQTLIYVGLFSCHTVYICLSVHIKVENIVLTNELSELIPQPSLQHCISPIQQPLPCLTTISTANPVQQLS